MITGAHILLFSADADADRAFLRDVLEGSSIFHTAEASPPAMARCSSSSTVGALSRYMLAARSSTDGPSPRRRLLR